jgi:hypothetical protein
MPNLPKQYKLRADQIKQLVPDNLGGCVATDMITVQGMKVGYMVREKPSKPDDSGWSFMAGNEPQDYMDNPANHGVFAVNTIANYDPEIIPFLMARHGAEFMRDKTTGQFVQINEKGQPVTRRRMNERWSIGIDASFQKREEDGALVYWRPGATIWINTWNTGQGRKEAIVSIKQQSSQTRKDLYEAEDGAVLRYGYFLIEEEGGSRRYAIYGFTATDGELIQMAIYVDRPKDQAWAAKIAQSLRMG